MEEKTDQLPAVFVENGGQRLSIHHFHKGGIVLGHESAEEIACGHQAGQEIGHSFAGGGGGTSFYAGHKAKMV